MNYTNDFLAELTARAQNNPRKRQHYDLRDSEEDTSMRMLNAIEPDTVIPVHRHTMTSEDVVVLRGSAVEIIYNDLGEVVEMVTMKPGSECVGCHVPMGAWHTCRSMESGTVRVEFKNTMYDATTSEEIWDREKFGVKEK